MKKLKLELERVQVQSFPTTSQSEAMHGTVFGAGITNTMCGRTCIGPSCCHTEWEARVEP